MAGYDRSTVKVYETSIQETDGVIEIHSRFSIASPAKQPFLRLEAVWKVDLDGTIFLSIDGNFGQGISVSSALWSWIKASKR